MAARDTLRADAPLAPSPDQIRPHLAQADYEALGAFRAALRRFLAFSSSEAEAQGLSVRQHQALLAIRAHRGPEPITIGDLARTLLIKNHSAIGLVDRLVLRGLVTREQAATDRRKVVLRLTQPGSAVLETISRNNLGKLKANLPVFADLLQALKQLELPAPPDEAGSAEGE